MSREIKFRGKDETLKKWLYGDLLQYNDGSVYIGERSKTFTDDGYQSPDYSTLLGIDEETIGQFTGLHDKNGKEIYEGDILMCIGERNDNKGRKYYRKVLFDNGAFGMTVPEYKCISALCNHVVNGKLNWEVIGNIYDNPELLEEKL